jgi:hypothetical protein
VTEAEAIAWLEKKGWHVTDLRVEALVAKLDLTSLDCTAWSDEGPCASCICEAMAKQDMAVRVRAPRESLN